MPHENRWRHPWSGRPVEEARLFNPAFCGELIGRTVVEFHDLNQESFGVSAAFLVLPLVLHRQTRESLPKNVSKAFANWTIEHSALLAELPGRTRHLSSVTRESLMFAVHHELLAFRAGKLLPGTQPVPIRTRKVVNTDDAQAIRNAAGLLGRWFARQRAESVILRGMGIAP